ncbi:unnamed protein product [Porites evermanni]|uniref:ER membrane protein complex subunit 6 n=1 Tax=Porites evermanni TaxID=104178 RepID=A0ABN8LXL8_9CNID|nr:unnamed protein product [Porites evermanni]
MANNSIIDFCRTSLASMAGISAGILGLSALKGFIFYFIASLFMSTYLLFWTFLYGMVHVY